MRKILLLLFAFLLIVSPVAAQKGSAEVNFFYSSGCPYCADMELFLDELKVDEPELVVNEYELRPNINYFFKLATAYDMEVGDEVSIPVVFVGEKHFSGYNEKITQGIEQEVQRCISEGCTPPTEDSKPLLSKLTIPAIIGAAAVDAINPCAFAVLILLLTTILATRKRRRALCAGLAFTIAIYISYFLMGIGIYSAIHAAGAIRIFYTIVAILAIFIGLLNLKDFFWYGKGLLMEVPLSWRPRMKGFIRGVTSIPGAFLVGILVSLFLLPCTSGPYIVILGLLAQVATRTTAMLYLVLYNFIFIIPMLAITFAIYSGLTTTEKAEAWRQRRLRWLHLVAGLIILALGIGMLVALVVGWV